MCFTSFKLAAELHDPKNMHWYNMAFTMPATTRLSIHYAPDAIWLFFSSRPRFSPLVYSIGEYQNKYICDDQSLSSAWQTGCTSIGSTCTHRHKLQSWLYLYMGWIYFWASSFSSIEGLGNSSSSLLATLLPWSSFDSWYERTVVNVHRTAADNCLYISDGTQGLEEGEWKDQVDLWDRKPRDALWW